MRGNTTTSGVTLVEVIIGVSLFALVLVFSVHTLNTFFTNATTAREKGKALYLATEGVEAVRALRDDDWATIAAATVETPYYVALTPTAISLTGTATAIDGIYTRTVTFESVYRDSVDDVVSSTTAGASIDSDSRWVTVTVSWGSMSTSLRALLTNIFDV